jgi:hypothetical protein
MSTSFFFFFLAFTIQRIIFLSLSKQHNYESKISRSDAEISFEISCQKGIRNFVADIRFWSSSSSSSSAWWQMFQKQNDEHTSIGTSRKRESQSPRPNEHSILSVCAWDRGTLSFLPSNFFSFSSVSFAVFSSIQRTHMKNDWKEAGNNVRCSMLCGAFYPVKNLVKIVWFW